MRSGIVALLVSAAICSSASAESGIRIGVLTDMSGAYSSFSGEGSVTAARMAVADFGGHVVGRPIEVISADHQNKPDNAATIANRWIDTEGVVAIIDVPLSGAALAVQESPATRSGLRFIRPASRPTSLVGNARRPVSSGPTTAIRW